MSAPVILLGTGSVNLAGNHLCEQPDGGFRALEQLFQTTARAAVVTSGGEPGFFRASLAIERGLKTVVIRKGLLPDLWIEELAARARLFGSDLFEHDDKNGYHRVTRCKERTSVGVPSSWAFTVPTVVKSEQAEQSPGHEGGKRYHRDESDSLLPLFENSNEHRESCSFEHFEEQAFRVGLKPVLYLVVPSAKLEEVRGRYADCFVEKEEEELHIDANTGRRDYGEGETHYHLFISVKQELAKRAAELWKQGSTKHVIELGALMGYPDCCTRAFAALNDRGNNAALVYITAARTRALGAAFNPLLGGVIRRMVPFTPCSYGCSAGGAWATRLLDSIEEKQATALMRAMRKLVYYVDESNAIVFENVTLKNEQYHYQGAQLTVPGGVVADIEQIRRQWSNILPQEGVMTERDGIVEIQTPRSKVILRHSNGLGVLLPFIG